MGISLFNQFKGKQQKIGGKVLVPSLGISLFNIAVAWGYHGKAKGVLVPSLGISLFNGGRDDEYRDGISSRPLSGDSFI